MEYTVHKYLTVGTRTLTRLVFLWFYGPLEIPFTERKCGDDYFNVENTLPIAQTHTDYRTVQDVKSGPLYKRPCGSSVSTSYT